MSPPVPAPRGPARRREAADPHPGAGAPPIFFAPRSYRRRRLGEAARLLPVLGAALFLLPALGLAPEDGGARLLFVGAAWLVLIAAAAAIARVLGRDPKARPGRRGPAP